MNEPEKKLLNEILLVMKNHPDFDPPFFRADGDLVIPLNSALKKIEKPIKDLQMHLVK